MFTILLLGGAGILGGKMSIHAQAATQPLIFRQMFAGCPGQVEVLYSADSNGNGNIACVARGQSGYFQNIVEIINQSTVTASFTANVTPTPPAISIPPGQGMSFQPEMTSGRSVNGAVTAP
jgi:hypothetical protein